MLYQGADELAIKAGGILARLIFMKYYTIKRLCTENRLKDRESSDHPRKLKLSSENRTASDERALNMQYEF